jgi:sigma-B regulation protein RsbU (phosphoserine phosphatase)
MSSPTDLIKKLTALNEIAETLNRTVDMQSALQEALVQLVELMGLETGWIFLRDPSSKNRWAGRGYALAAHHNLPPAMALGRARAWKGGCQCQSLCNRGELVRSYNQVRCSRLSSAGGNRQGLTVHASTPLCSGERVLGILNVAAPNWAAFTQEALALLTNAGSQMGIALDRAQLFDMLQEQRIHEQAALLDLSNQLLSRLDMDDLMSHLVEEVQRLLEADACTLLLPDDDSQYLAFRAASGWQHTDPIADQRRAPANEVSGPGLVMQTQQPLLVRDLQRADPAPWTPDWLRTEGFRGHAAMPLIAEGHSIGALVIDSHHPRQFDEDEVRFFQLLANQAAIAIEKARLHQEALKRQRMMEELSVARQIQLSLLPDTPPIVPGWEFAAFYRAARLVGGDFYDFFELPGKPDQWGVVIADVADKGVPSALYMALCRTVIRTTALSGRSPASALMRANTLILQDSQSDLFLSAVYAKIDTDTGRLIFCNAGHNRPLWLRAGRDKFEELSTKGIVLGVFEGIELEEKRIDVAPGDLLVFYTDGVTEAIDAGEREFGAERLKKIVVSNADASAQQVVEAVVDAVNAFADDAPPFDDLTLMIVKRLATGK